MSSVDVIVPCYRYGHYLRECVESVLSQLGVDVSVLVIDDASPDNTAEVATELANKDPRVSVIRHDVNKGHINTYNEGIEWASAKYMLILSADDYLLPGALRLSASLMDVHDDVGLTYGKAIVLDEGVPETETATVGDRAGWRILKGMEFIDLSGSNNIVPTPTAVVRTELQKRLGGYRLELPHSGDMEMWLRLAAHGFVGVIEAQQAVYRRHASNMSLQYTEESFMPDLRQRKAAIDWFFKTSSSVLPNPEQIRYRQLRSLAEDAVSLASTAFNENEMELSERLSDYARELCPEIERSAKWMKLAGKRFLGYWAWNTLRPTISRNARLVDSNRD